MPGGSIQLAPPRLVTDQLLIDPATDITQFKTQYKRHQNFAKQRFRINYTATNDIHSNEPTRISFKIQKYADLLSDVVLCIQLPDIWSPIQSPIEANGFKWTPYEFRWIENIGCHIIKEIEFNCGGQILQKISGEYLAASASRDMSHDKKRLFDEMTGNVLELHDPASSFTRAGMYPSAYHTSNPFGAEPSIRGRIISIPLRLWFTEQKGWIFPLCAVRDMDIWISVTLRPTRELFRVRDITDAVNSYPYIQPDFGNELFQMYRFLQTPPAIELTADSFVNKRPYWDADIHLMTTQIFLDTMEKQYFINKTHQYLIPVVTEYDFQNQNGTAVITLPTNGLVSSWMIRARRNDAFMRNEWDNYTNWPYKKLPANIYPAPKYTEEGNIGPGLNPDGGDNFLFITGALNNDNYMHIVETMAIKIDGEYRESRMTRNVFQYMERYNQTQGSGELTNGLYCYHFGLQTGYFGTQPNGYINTAKYNKVDLEFTLITPSVDETRAPNTTFQCNAEGEIIGIRKDTWRLFQYVFEIRVFEERFNLLTFQNGTCQFVYV
jgi:hypothetical protein